MKLDEAVAKMNPGWEYKFLVPEPPDVLYLFTRGLGLHVNVAESLHIDGKCTGGYCKLDSGRIIMTEAPTSVRASNQKLLDSAASNDVQLLKDNLNVF